VRLLDCLSLYLRITRLQETRVGRLCECVETIAKAPIVRLDGFGQTSAEPPVRLTMARIFLRSNYRDHFLRRGIEIAFAGQANAVDTLA